MDGSNSVSIVILNLDTILPKESTFARYLSLNKTSNGKLFKIVVWSWSWFPSFVYALGFYPASQGWMFWARMFFLMELMVEHVSRRIQFGLMILVIGASFVVWIMVSPTCNYCNPLRLLAFDDGQFTA